jgi:endonuclease YncB( thermonuclease family)
MPRSRNFRRRRSIALPGALLLTVAAGAGIGLIAADGRSSAAGTSAPAYADVVTGCRVVDGDTLHCDGGRVRLLGIDAPELPGHCAQGRDCAQGDPYESTRSLETGMGDGSSLSIAKVGTDRYGRTLAMVRGRGGDLSCWQLAHHQAIYKPAWDNGGRVAATCPDSAR